MTLTKESKLEYLDRDSNWDAEVLRITWGKFSNFSMLSGIGNIVSVSNLCGDVLLDRREHLLLLRGFGVK